jgi:prephenate dehydrogenase
MNIAIVGVGLIGGSAAIRLREIQQYDKIIGVDKSESNRKKALQLNLVDEFMDIDDAIEQCKVIILTVPVDAIMQLIPHILDKVTDQVVIDMGSTKINILQQIADHPHRSPPDDGYRVFGA